jgi:hypothetical protein
MVRVAGILTVTGATGPAIKDRLTGSLSPRRLVVLREAVSRVRKIDPGNDAEPGIRPGRCHGPCGSRSPGVSLGAQTEVYPLHRYRSSANDRLERRTRKAPL